jgi:hypothetical protein
LPRASKQRSLSKRRSETALMLFMLWRESLRGAMPIA